MDEPAPGGVAYRALEAGSTRSTSICPWCTRAIKAFEYLLGYFSQVEEPTLILLFGDHQPQVATNFYTDVLGTAPDTALAQKKQMVPFVLWANYDIPEAQGVELSLNYLSALLMDTANLPMTGYQKYLARLWEAPR